MKKKHPFLIAIVFIFCFLNSFSQQHAFYSDIQQFKKNDSIHFPPSNAILFIGSSSFTKWTDVQSYFPEATIINRGFGGSTLEDVIYYANDVILPYHPREIVIYCGENDLASSDTVTSMIVFDRFKTLFSIIRSTMPKIPIVFISLKPSPSRERLMPKMVAANTMIKAFLRKQPHTFFVDVYHKMLNVHGIPLPDIYIEDKLHMNSKGYHIWQKALRPYLIPDKK